MSLRSTVIIPTYNRPSELKGFIESLLRQTKMPDELIVVDDGNLPGIPLKSECEDSGIKCIYLKKDVPGLTESRNAGINVSSGDIILFFDDDVVLSPEYLEEIMSLYQEDEKGAIMGVGGVIDNIPPLSLKLRLRKIFDVVFLLSGFSEGRVLPSGFCVDYGYGNRIKKLKEVDFLPGCACSYRKAVFSEFSFTEQYRDYGFGEDKDFSYQVAKKYKIMINPKARLLHLESPKMRPDKTVAGRKFIMGYYMFFSRHVKQGFWSWIIFYYSMTGYLLARCMALMVFPNKGKVERLKGVFDAMKDIIGGSLKV